MAVSEDEMITLKVAERETGIPARTLRYAAMVGNLRATKTETPIGEVYETTLRDVRRWEGTYKPRVKK